MPPAAASAPVAPRAHWDRVHGGSEAEEASWWQPEPARSLRLLDLAGAGSDARVIDVGCGQSGLCGALLDRGFRRLDALDVSEHAVRKARARLGARAELVRWHVVDATRFQPPHPYDVWHDRATFHFLLREKDRRRYADVLRRALAPGGRAIVATFAPDGPETCSGLPVARWDGDALAAELGLDLVRAEREDHRTPWGTTQAFTWALLRARE